MAVFEPISNIQIVGLSGQQLWQNQAQRLYNGATVILTNTNRPFFYANPNDNNIFTPTSSASNATQLQVQYLQNSFQFQLNYNGQPINHETYIEFLRTGTYSDINSTLFSFDITNGVIRGIFPYQAGGRISAGHMFYDDGQADRIRCSDDQVTSARWIALRIIKPSAYIEAADKVVNPIQCCSGSSGPGYRDEPSVQVCIDRGLTSADAPQCYNLFAQSCTGDQLLTPQCIKFCSQKGVNCDAVLQNLAAQKPDLLKTNSDVVACFQPQSFYSTFFNSLTSKVPALAGLPLFPYCSFPACAVPSAVKPFNVKNQNTPPCPNLTTCVSQVTIDNSGSIVGDVPISQTLACKSITENAPVPPTVRPAPNSTPSSTNSTPYPPSTPAPVPVPDGTTTTIPSTASSSSSNTGLIIGIILLVLFLAIGGYFLYKRHKKSELPTAIEPQTTIESQVVAPPPPSSSPPTSSPASSPASFGSGIKPKRNKYRRSGTR